MAQKVIFKALKPLKWRNDSLGKEFIILADSFPNRKEDLCFLRDSFFLFPFEYIHKTKRIQNLTTTGKQLYPLFLLQGLMSSTFTEDALASLCKSLASILIQKIKKRFCSSLSKSFPLNTGTKLASSSFARVIQHRKKCTTNENGFSCEALPFCSSKTENYLSRLLKISGVKWASRPYTLCCSSRKTLYFLRGKGRKVKPLEGFLRLSAILTATVSCQLDWKRSRVPAESTISEDTQGWWDHRLLRITEIWWEKSAAWCCHLLSPGQQLLVGFFPRG